MSMSDLEKMGLLRPKAQWGDPQPIRHVNPWAVGSLGGLAIASVIVMLVADGSLWTWIAIGGFLACLTAFTWINVRAAGPGETTVSNNTRT